MSEFDFDLLVIGSGPGGLKAAYHAAKLNKKVAVVERKSVVGGVSVNVGTIPSKTLREAVLDLSGYHEKSFYGQSYIVKERITIDDLLHRTDVVIRHEVDVLRDQLSRNGVELIQATASFCDPHTLNLEAAVDGRGLRLARAANRHRGRDPCHTRSARAVRWQKDLHERRHPDARPAPEVDGRHRRRRHRNRIREYVLRAWDSCNPRRQAPADPAVR
jgi:glycine/D-amino acid oxidase-like deaminating enzyme